MNDIKKLLDIAKSKDTIGKSNDFDSWLIEMGYLDAPDIFNLVPACFMLREYLKARNFKSTYKLITSRIVFKSELLKSCKKQRLNLNGARPTGYYVPASLFNPTKHDIIEATAWWQHQNQKSRKQRETIQKIMDSKKSSSRKSSRNIMT